MLRTDISNVPNFVRTNLSNMKKSNLKLTYQFLNDMLSSDPSQYLYKQYFLQCFDIIDCKLYKPMPNKCKRKPPENVCNIFFDNKGVEFINLARILRDPDVVSSFPKLLRSFPHLWLHIDLGCLSLVGFLILIVL